MTDILPIVWSSRLRAFLPGSDNSISDINNSGRSNNNLFTESPASTPTSLSSTISPLSHTDKILLPPSTLESLLSQTSNDATLLPSPLLFRLTNPLNKKITHVGVREFSADEGTVQIPIGVARNLDLRSSNDLVLVNLVSLPKGSSLTLKTNSTAGSENVDWKVLLESRLHGAFTALTEGDVLTVSHPSIVGKNFDFTIEKVEPENKANAICIIDTDLDLEVIEMHDGEVEGESRSGPGSKSLAGVVGSHDRSRDSKSSTPTPSAPINLTINSGPLEITNLLPGEVARFIVDVNRSDLTTPLIISPENISLEDSSSLLIFVGTDENSISEESFLWSNLKSPGGAVTISPTDPFLDPPSAPSPPSIKFHILIQSKLSSVSFSLQARTDVNETDLMSDDISPSSSSTKCPNCHQPIPGQSLARHIAFCERNNLLCPDGCGKIFSRREGIPTTHWHCHEHDIFGDSDFSNSLHNSTFHSSITCQGCNSTFSNLISLAQHKSTDCPAKLHICKFCHLLLPQEESSPADALQGLTGHESYCGNRTTDCDICKRAVRLKEFQTHLEFHRLDRLNEPVPIVCSNANCPRLVPASNTNSLGLCGVCNGPLHSTLLDPTGSKLKQRIERRYVIQLTRGCGKPWCINEYCASTKKRTMAEIMSSDIKFLNESADSNQFWFCVDETATKRQLFVQFEAQEGVHSPIMCAKAIDEAKGNESEARRWLQMHST